MSVVNTLLRSKEASRVWKSAARGLSRWMLTSPSITKGVPSSGKVESNTSNSSINQNQNGNGRMAIRLR